MRNPWGRDIPRSLLSCKSSKNGKEIYAFKEGYSDGKDNNPNDGIVRVGRDSIKFFITAAVTKEDTAAKLRGVTVLPRTGFGDWATWAKQKSASLSCWWIQTKTTRMEAVA